MALAALAVLLLLLGVSIDTLLGVQTRRNVHDRLMATASRADALAAVNTPPDQLVAQLGGGGIRALLVAPDGSTFGDRAIRADAVTGPTVPPPPPPPVPPPAPPPWNQASPGWWPPAPGWGPPPPPPGWGPPPPGWGPPPPPPPPKRPPPDATASVIVHPLRTGGRVILVADTTATAALIRRLRETMIAAGLITLAAAGVLLSLVTRAALHPLDRLTALARTITGGDRGQRLHPDRTDTELGRAAAAFDGMLDALETSERRAQHSAETARRAEATTRQFLADVAHELRTPIAGIRAAAEQLHTAAAQHGDDPRAAGQYRRAELLLAESRRASRLVADMLDLTRIDAGVTLDVAETDLAALADAECERAAMLSPDLTVIRTGEPAMTVRADPNRIAQILSNLVDNARRHTPPAGRIVIDVGRTDHDQSADRATVTVTDSGPGIPETERERIFDRLVRLDAARDADHGGAGLGLSIARALARAHDGDLVCLPHRDGACFQLTLPLSTKA
ncbi:HAMP domain-containing sensor histidine kinase [Mycobacterium sp.]|uniref:sensor histidine kinase n=1 Tax=Mycobacterium sp. TaxID=1785 RepID=UPI00127C7608|nr:HAMP domain-containing sensor histidine kinase [Mycobacterium sp.]KAA8969840.1 MAG: HAMP domain-containing histidine kinase [Mycobacterium sp.]